MTKPELREKILDVVCRQMDLDVSEIELKTLEELGADSFDALQIGMKIEDFADRELTDQEIMDLFKENVDQITEKIWNIRKGQSCARATTI